MAPIIRMPSESELPPGPMRYIVEQLFELYRDARRPTLRQISQEISRSDVRGTASTEMIRRMLRGIAVPSQWATMEAVVTALCTMSGRPPTSYWFSHKRDLQRAWNEVLDDSDRPDLAKTPAATADADTAKRDTAAL
jgi:hypothetical protein